MVSSSVREDVKNEEVKKEEEMSKLVKTLFYKDQVEKEKQKAASEKKKQIEEAKALDANVKGRIEVRSHLKSIGIEREGKRV